MAAEHVRFTLRGSVRRRVCSPLCGVLCCQVEDIIKNMGHGPPFRSTVHSEVSPTLAQLEWWWKCALRGWAFRLRFAPAESVPPRGGVDDLGGRESVP